MQAIVDIASTRLPHQRVLYFINIAAFFVLGACGSVELNT